MAITIVATVGGASSNSFVTEVEQIAYMATRLNAGAWTTVTGTDCTEPEKKAMIEATRDISRRTWQGRPATTTQALAWPRWWVQNPDSPVGFLYDTDEIPDRVKTATMELAFQYLKQGTEDLAAADPNAGVIEKTVGPITTRWESSSVRPQGIDRLTRVMREIGPLLDESVFTKRAVRG